MMPVALPRRLDSIPPITGFEPPILLFTPASTELAFARPAEGMRAVILGIRLPPALVGVLSVGEEVIGASSDPEATGASPDGMGASEDPCLALTTIVRISVTETGRADVVCVENNSGMVLTWNSGVPVMTPAEVSLSFSFWVAVLLRHVNFSEK